MRSHVISKHLGEWHLQMDLLSNMLFGLGGGGEARGNGGSIIAIGGRLLLTGAGAVTEGIRERGVLSSATDNINSIRLPPITTERMRGRW